MYKRQIMIIFSDLLYKEELETLLWGYFELHSLIWVDSHALILTEKSLTQLSQSSVLGLEELLMEDFDTSVKMYISPYYKEDTFHEEMTKALLPLMKKKSIGVYYFDEMIPDYLSKEPESPLLVTLRHFFNSESVDIVFSLVENNLNLSHTAKSLFIHRNTLNYRLDKIEEQTGLNLKTFKGCMSAYLLLKNRQND